MWTKRKQTNLFHQKNPIKQCANSTGKQSIHPKNSTESTEYAPSISQPNLSPNSTKNRPKTDGTKKTHTNWELPYSPQENQLQNSKKLSTHTLGRPYLVDTPSMESTKFSEHPGASSLRASMNFSKNFTRKSLGKPHKTRGWGSSWGEVVEGKRKMGDFLLRWCCFFFGRKLRKLWNSEMVHFVRPEFLPFFGWGRVMMFVDSPGKALFLHHSIH